MADSYNKKEREKKKEKKRKEKAERKLLQKTEGKKEQEEFMYMDEDGNLTTEKPDPTKKKKEFNVEDIAISVPKKEDIVEELVKTGSVKFFNTEKGYGFISRKDSNESFFVHVNNLIDEVKENDKVSFEVEMGPKGPIAVNVKLI